MARRSTPGARSRRMGRAGAEAYSEVIETWRTSCPRLTIWEDAVDRGYVARETVAGVGVDGEGHRSGEKLLREHGREADGAIALPSASPLTRPMRCANSCNRIHCDTQQQDRNAP